MRWIFHLQQRLAITTNECIALGVAVALLASGLLVREFAPAAQPFPVDYIEDDAAFATRANANASRAGAAALAPAAPPRRVDAAGTSSEPGARVDVNRADAAALVTLPRIGPALAQRILDERARRGPFRSLDDLRRVRGIGEKTVAELAPFACVDCGGDVGP